VVQQLNRRLVGRQPNTTFWHSFAVGLFQPIAAETLGRLNQSSIAFFLELGRKIASISEDNREPSFLLQRMSITIQRFNSILLHNSFCSDEE